jgi:SAM-dependent methyltransferase
MTTRRSPSFFFSMPPDAQYWNDRYSSANSTWDMHQVSPPLQAYFTQLHDKQRSILIPGCGNSYEAAWLLDHDFTSITLIDISELLTARLRKQFAAIPDPFLQIITGDFFQFIGQYDLIVEQTFFCALDPSLREKYITHMHSLLRPGGKLIGLLFDRNFVDGPPFGGHKTEYQDLLEKKFRIKTLSPCYNSIPARAGSELFFIAEKP